MAHNRLSSEDTSANGGSSAALTPTPSAPPLRRPGAPTHLGAGSNSAAQVSSVTTGGTHTDLEAVAAKLLDPNGDIKMKIYLTTELRETIDLCHRDMEFARHLDVIISAAIDILSKTRPVFLTTTWDYKFRHLLLDILSRIPMHEIMRLYALEVMNLLIELIRYDNEESVIICFKLGVDLYRSFTSILEPTVVSFFGTIIEMYDMVPKTTEEIFGDIKIDRSQFDGVPVNLEGSNSTPSDNSKTSTENNKSNLMRRTVSGASNTSGAVGVAAADPASTEAIRGMQSFKALQECPVAVVFLLQTYKAIVQASLPGFLPIIFKFLNTSPRPQVIWHEVINERGQGSFVGVAPAIIKVGKRNQYTDLLVAQVKIMSFVAYVLRAQTPIVQPFAPDIPPIVIRMLKDIPPESSLSRRELIIAARHILGTDHRALFFPFLSDLLDFRIFIGNGITAFESLRHLVYSTIADLVQQTKSELKSVQIKGALVNFVNVLNDPTSSTATQAMAGKVIYSLVEFITPHRFEPQEAIRISWWLMENFVRKLEALGQARARQLNQIAERREKAQNGQSIKEEGPKDKAKAKDTEATQSAVVTHKRRSDTIANNIDQAQDAEDVLIERGKVLGGLTSLLEPPPDQSKEVSLGRRVVTRSCITSFQILLGNLKKMDATLPDATLLGRLFTAGIQSFGAYAYRRELREVKEIIDSFIYIFTQIDLVLFTETIEPHMATLVKELCLNAELLAFPQYLLANQVLSKTFIGITLRYLMKHLRELGQDKRSGIMVRLFKMCFMAVTLFQENEVVLQPHLSDLIMGSLRFASVSNEPGQYYSVLRALFRSIGGGRFEILYKEVLPLLQVLLEELNVLLNSATDPKERDLFAELCLTVPVRLSVLLPYLTYLMRPLVVALQAIPDLVSQGLRTLELCVDNLTQEFLNPLMAPVIHEVMASLWKLLKPLPYNPQHAPTTLRILGKLGGRNRKILGPTKIEWKPTDGQSCCLPIHLDGQKRSLCLPPLVELAARMMRRGDTHYIQNGFSFLKNITPVFLAMGHGPGEREETFAILLKGLCDATRIPELLPQAQAHLSSLFQHIFITELWQEPTSNPDRMRSSLAFTSPVFDALIDNLSLAIDQQHFKAASSFTFKILQNLFQRTATPPFPNQELLAFAKRTLCSKASSSCYDHSWPRKCAGHEILSLLVKDLDMGANWLSECELEIARALLFLHKDAPSASEKILEGPTDTFLKLLSICHTPTDAPDPPEAAVKLNYLIGLLIIELCSQTSGVRRVAQSALQLISERKRRPLHELLLPVRERLSPIFGKPLRALAFPMQIGHLDALTFCVRLDPPLFEYSDQLMRMLQEALGIADADDVALIGRTNQAKTAQALIELRVVCLKFLAATLKLPEMRQQSATKAKILSVYFQSLYAKNAEVVDVAHASLKELLASGGSRLPKDLLQTGLRPVLNNLSDHKKLTLPSLQGLARLVELLTNYFKVEIGSKLLEHFRQLSDPQALAAAALSSSQTNGVLDIMAGVINIFHLLACPAAGVYLRDLISYVVHVETILKKATASPFTKPMALYINMYPDLAATHFFQRLDDERHINTLKWVLLSDYADNFRAHLQNTILEWLQQSYAGNVAWGLHGTIILQQLTIKDPESIANSVEIVHLISQRWVSDGRKGRLASCISDDHFAQLKEDAISIEIMVTCVRLNKIANIDLLFHMADVLGGSRLIEYSHIIRFYHEQVLTSRDVAYKSAILSRFLDIINNDDVCPQQKTAILRHLINPLLLVAFERGEEESMIVDADYINKVYLVIWCAFIPNTNVKSFTTDDKLNIEMLHMASLILEYRPHLVADQRKEIIKFGWGFLSLKDDQTVKNTAYILIARFIDAYDSPTKIVSQILLALLKLHTGEAKHLAQKALDILLPALPKRYKDNPTEWVRLTRRTLIEEGQNLPFLFSVYSAVVRNPDPFFSHRDMFIPQFAAAMPRLAVSGGASGETRTLVVDLIEVIVRWEQQRIEMATKDDQHPSPEPGSSEKAADVEQPSSKRAKLDRSGSFLHSASGSGTYVVPYATRDGIVSILIRIIAAANEPALKNALVSKALSLIRLVLTEVWPEVEVKLTFFQRALTTEPTDNNLAVVCNTAEVLNIVLGNKTDDWLLSNLALVQTLVENGIKAKHEGLLSIQRPLLNRLFRVLPVKTRQGDGELGTEKAEANQKVEAEVTAFEQWANRTIKEGFKEEPRSPESFISALVLMQAWDQAQPTKIDPFIPDTVKVFQRVIRDHLTADSKLPIFEQTRHLLESLCNLMKTRVGTMGENRLYLLSGLVQLVEKSSSIQLCRYILGVQRKWIEDKDPLPTVKEKATMLLKMMSYDLKGDDDLVNDYLQLILDIYVSNSLSRSEFTVKLEPAFLLGCRSRDAEIRTKFMAVFDENLRREPFARLHYLIGIQNWEPLADINWIHHALDLFLGSIEANDVVLSGSQSPYPLPTPSEFLKWSQLIKVGDIITCARQLLYADPTETEKIWVSLFQAAWSTFTQREQADLTRYLVTLLSKDHLMKAIERRPNVVQILLAGVAACSPPLILPPHLVRYLGKTFSAWYTAIEHLQEICDEVADDEGNREVASDALAQLYGELSETDIFYGQWRRRSLCAETNAAMSYEQIGEWGAAQQAYEVAQEMARANLLPFGQGEYNLWEDHWILCAQKIQQWDFLSELARAEHSSELLLECQWRQSDWSVEYENIELAIENLPVQSIRKITFQAYLTLLKNHMGLIVDENRAEFTRLCDEGIQLCLHQWFQLPDIVTEAHIPLMQAFQQFVELQEAAQIFSSLRTTNAQNLDARSADLKHVLQTWRERLPNIWDDINVWSDLVAWRKHVFTMINKAYLPLVQPSNQTQGANSSLFAHRGHHETAWIVNRFAHVARKHHLIDVCMDSLTKIYTLPNIEISDAFLKLCEQAKCHYGQPDEVSQGYELMRHTNLIFFGPSQKAEFYTLKAMYLAKLNMHEEASQVFNQALSLDFQFPKAWAEWGNYQDRLFTSSPQDLQLASGAVNCYLQASGLYKNSKVWRMLVRILWFLGLDDANGTIGRAFDSYKGDIPIWNWAYFVPQLLSCLSAPREARYAKALLTKIAKSFPQSLFFYIRTANDELAVSRQRALHTGHRTGVVTTSAISDNNPQVPSSETRTPQTGVASSSNQPGGMLPISSNAPSMSQVPMAFEHVDDIIGTLKTQFPLLALSMEMLVDQLYQRFKAPPEEDVHRLLSALLQDALTTYIQRASDPHDDLQVSEVTKANLARFSENLSKMPMQPHFHREFVESSMSLPSYVNKLQEWRNKYEKNIERKIRKSNLENASHWMVEFQYQKFDEIEVPGQYLKRLNEESNAHFVKIHRFDTVYGYHRHKEHWFRRITMIGHDASQHSFVIQMPTPRPSRREERIMQFFRMLNCTLARKKESRSRDLFFSIPVIIPFAPNIRIAESNSSYCTLQEIYESYCAEAGFSRDDPLVAYAERLRSFAFEGVEDVQSISTKLEIADEITTKMIPNCIVKNYFSRTMKTAGDLWYFRKRMTMQYAGFIFMTYVFSIGQRTPHRITFDRSNGCVYTTDIFPNVLTTRPELGHSEAVPFRFTPNIQHFMTRQNIEGLLTASVLAIAYALTEQENDLDHRLSIFVRDEVMSWSLSAPGKLPISDANVKELVLQNIEVVVKRARLLACEMERKTLDPSAPQPVCQTITELINQASNISKLYSMDPTWMPWL
ncbi:hypothetical protein O181_002240 [Austropuccinia psidii MF-1]|uniref:Non-specific serine/threonine protein kinase n=1 Tax=Austropuccinia psidii MF-1 TaxID=1389203 RepID=A0A9Q3BCM9_9BASI|nr:hypothetical protein [Austropuccinia psidii MF-1]